MRTAASLRGWLLLAGLLTVLLTLGACSGSGGSDRPPAERLAAAKRQLDETSGVRIGLSTDQLPPGVSGLKGADGIGTHAPAFEGSLQVSASGVVADAEVVAVDDVVHAKLPFAADFSEIDPAEYDAPDPATLLDPDEGLSVLLTETEDVEEGEQVRDGEEVRTTFTGTAPGATVARIMPSASSEGEFEATYTLSDDDRLTRAVLTGPFYPDADDVTYTITFADYGTEREITAP